VTNTLVKDSGYACVFYFDRCKLGSGVTILASQTSNPHLGSPEAWLLDCASGDTHGIFGYYNALGSLITEGTIKYTGGAAGQSWKIVTNSNATPHSPFVTPWVTYHNTTLSSITPRFEILRNDSTTAYRDDQVYAEFEAKTTSNSTLGTFYSDAPSLVNRLTAGGSAQATGAGLSAWENESGTAWSGKCDSGSAFTPAENGHISGRLVVTGALTVYMDPQVRS
jgi:hypothetical protein